VVAAKKESIKRDLPLKIGFGSVPDGPMAVPGFWEALAKAGGNEFRDSVDFVGHNFYVDVFEEKPMSEEEISASVGQILRNLRKQNLPAAGIPDSVPIRVTENGWPTGNNPFTGMERSYARQAEVMESIIRTIYGLRTEYNISHYEFFGLRDADSLKEDLFHQFGIMRDDYAPKPAYDLFKRLIEEFGM
jgi:exo-beta-1,3-glucanase (GH17 family)